jgi:dienelactone hydrolase
MRIFELAFVSLLATAAVWSLVSGPKYRAILSLLFGLCIAFVVLHVIFEGAHWQMAPAYLGALVFAGMLMLKSSSGALRIAGAVAMMLLVFITCCLSAVLPMFRLPRPTGPYAVGTRVLYLVDRSRTEDQDPGRKRELMVQIWYPATPSRNSRAPYRRREETTPLSSYQSVLWTHSRWNAPVAKNGGKFPVLLFNPGWNGRRTSNTYLVEDLASHGFVVAGIDHPYNSDPVVFPDGRVVLPRSAYVMDFSKHSLQEILSNGNDELLRQTADTLFVLNQMEEMNSKPESPFYRRLDTQHAGALGFSMGGAVAAQACLSDPRIRSALDLDGSLFGPVRDAGLPKPFMFILEDVTLRTPQEIAQLPHAQQVDAALDISDDAMFRKYGGYRIHLHGATHVSFTDKAIFSPFPSLSGAGKLPPRRQFFIIRQYAVAFFEQTLKGESPALLEAQTSPFREASFQVLHGEGK